MHLDLQLIHLLSLNLCSIVMAIYKGSMCFHTIAQHFLLPFINPFFLVSLVYFFLTLCFPCTSRGHNQRMEFLGDSIMQLVATEYLFIHFPDHHEGHLTVRSNHSNRMPPPTTDHLLLFEGACNHWLLQFTCI